jgi:hypothetical protein
MVVGSSFTSHHPRREFIGEDTAMDLKTSLPLEGAASAQLVRPDVAQASWLAFPFAAVAWGMSQPMVVHGSGQSQRALDAMELDANVLIEQIADFDAWRVGGGVAFRW